MSQSAAVLMDRLRELELEQRQLSVYDRPIGMKLLYEDPRSGAEHYLIRYPKGMKAKRHRHPAAHTIVVLEGRFVANGEVIGPGGYAHFPANEVMHHAATEEQGCLFVIVFDGPSEVEVVDA